MTISNGMAMKLSSWRPFYFFIILSIGVLLFPCLLIPLWINKVNEIQRDVKLITGDFHQGVVLGVEKTAKLLSPFNQSAIDLARILSSVLGRNQLHFSTIETRVVPKLFQALSTIPHISQVSFIALDGLFFSYYTKGNKRFAVYSNTSLSATNYTWNTRPANFDTGKLYGEAIQTTPHRILDTSWFQNALKSTNGHASAGTGWENDQDPLILNTISVGTTGALCLGFPAKSLADFFTDASVYGGGLYFASNDGIVFSQGIPNTQMVLDGNSVSIQLLNPNGDQIGSVGNLTCQANDGMSKSYSLRIWKTKYQFQCSPLVILGMQSVYLLAFPSNFGGLENILHHNIKSALVLLILLVASLVVFILTFIFLMYRAAKRETALCAALIKQKEVTQQAEKKGMNISHAYASATHDVRASLAGITGLIEMCRRCVPPRSDLEIRLGQAEACTEDLSGILNSILDSSKIEAGKIQLEKQEFNIEQLVEETVDLFHPVGMKKGVDVVLDTCDGSVRKFPQVFGDRGRLKQVLSNLLSNAVKFTSEGHVSVRVWAKKPSPEIPILASSPNDSKRCMPCSFCQNDKRHKDLEVADSVEEEDESRTEYIFEVNDTGKGIPKEKQKDVFENYVQVKEAASQHEGTGLGLGIVQSLVRMMGGEISIVDKEPGERGTCFRFNIFLPFSGSPTSISPLREEEALEFYNCHSSSDSSRQHSEPITRAHSPKAEGSQVILFVSGEERSNVLKKFMRRLGIKVSVVKQYQQLPLTLKKIKEKLLLTHPPTSMSHGRVSMSENLSSTQEEVALSVADDAPFSEIKNKTAEETISSNFVLMVIDTSAGPFQELNRAVAEFRRDLSNIFNIVVWIDRPGSGSMLAQQSLYKEKLPPTDQITSKPFHGSRLYQVIGLLPEFGGRQIEPNNSDVLPESIPSAQTEIQETNDYQPLRGKKFLVAEDNPVLRKIAVAFVSHLGAETYECKDGEEALKLVVQDLNYQKEHRARVISPFDCILMDCVMPVMDGYEATRKIREVEKQLGLHISIFGLTAHTEDEVYKMTDAGMDHCLFKPLKQDQLLEAMLLYPRKHCTQ